MFWIGKKKTISEVNKLSTKMVSTKFGCDRGTPIDRYYIEKFLDANRRFIKGDVIEIGDNYYTMKYGEKITNSSILTQDVSRNIKGAVIGDLVTGEGCNMEAYDCFICTQTFPFIYDINSAAKNMINMLKPGGRALITVRGISMISKYDDDRWGDYWGFTETSLKKLFSQFVDERDICVNSYGNPKVATAFIYGLCQEDIDIADFDDQDDYCPVIITANVHR